MAILDSIINIDIQLQTLPLPQQGFGMPLVLGVKASGVSYQEITKVDSLTGYVSTDPEYKMVSAFFSQSPRPEKCAVFSRATGSPGPTITEALDELILTKNSWYALLITERTKADLQEAGTWCGSHEKLFIGCTDDETALVGRNQIREAYMMHKTPTIYPDAIWAGSCLPYTPGSITWAFKPGNGVTESGFNTTEQSAILNPSTGNAPGNVYGTHGGVIVSFEGKTTAGEFIDVIHSRDYVKARLFEEIARLQVTSPKIPYTIEGFTLLESTVRGVLKDCGAKGIVATVSTEDDKTRSDLGDYQYMVTVPESLSEISANDRASRKMPLSFKFRYAGAIHIVDIEGVITV